MAQNDDKKDSKKNDAKVDSKSDTKVQSESSKITDTLKKIISSGSPTEISKEIVSTVVGQALKAKDDVTTRVTNEMIGLVRKIDFVKEFSKFAVDHKFKVTAEIEISKKNKTESDDEV